MKKLLIPVFLLFSLIALSQSYVISPSSKIITKNISLANLSNAWFSINKTNANILLKYELMSNNLVPGWFGKLCTCGQCYSYLPINGTFNSIQFNNWGAGVDIYVNPYLIPGVGTVKYYVYENGNYLNGDTLTWIFNAQGVTNINENNLLVNLNIYPNPNNGIFTIKSELEGIYTIVNQLGQTIQSFKLDNTNNYSIKINELNSGIYYILGNTNKQTTAQKFIVNK